MSAQLALPLALAPHARFATFFECQVSIGIEYETATREVSGDILRGGPQ